MPPRLEDQAATYRSNLQLRLYKEQLTTAQLHKSFLLSNLSTAEKADVDKDKKPAAKDATHTAAAERAAEKANVEMSVADQAAAFRSNPQPRLSPVQFTTAQPHNSIILSNLSTAQDAAEKADLDEDEKPADERPAAKDNTHTAAAVKAEVERAAEKANVKRTADKVNVERACQPVLVPATNTNTQDEVQMATTADTQNKDEKHTGEVSTGEASTGEILT